MKMLLISLALFSIVSSHSLESNLIFENFKSKFGKKYVSETEHEMRKYIFHKNLEYINQINNDPSMTWTAAINEYTDLLPSEFEKMFGYNRSIAFSSYQSSSSPKDFILQNLPDSVDWRTKNVVGPVKNQLSCGSCWAFASTATLESHIAIQTGQLLSFSEQQLVDCTPNPQQCGGTGGCEGATQWLAFEYYKTAGATDEETYGYKARDGTCDASKVAQKKVTIEDLVRLPANDYNALMTAVATYGPVSVSVAASAWQFYSSGVYNGNCGTVVNHAVVIVGYGEDSKSGPYWIVRNSWGKTWGEQGYIRIAREKSAADVKCGIDKKPSDGSGCKGGPSEITVCGLCGLYSDSSYPIGGKIAGQ